MWNNILNVIYSLINVMGTIWSVLSILGLKLEDLRKAITYAGIAETDKSLMTQREQARYGVALIVVGFIFQSLNLFVTVNSFCEFLKQLFLMIVVLATVCIGIQRMNKKFRKEYEDNKIVK